MEPAMLELDVMKWAKQNFDSCELGDARRTKRAVQVAAVCARDPSGSTPEQTEGWCDCKSVYRLFNEEDVTFQGIGKQHWKQTCARKTGTYLIINDTTDTDFGIHREVKGLSQTGNGGGSGFLLHSALMVGAEDESVIGMAGQVLRYRISVPKNEKRTARLNRPRESQMWGQLIDQIGPPPNDARFIHVCDRAADDFANYCHFLENRTDWIVRARSLHRKVLDRNGKEIALQALVSKQSVLGTYELELRATRGCASRTAKIEVRSTLVSVPAPVHRDQYLKDYGVSLIVMYAVEVREVQAPRGVEPLHWLLLTSLCADTFEDCWHIVEYYEKRPIIEEFHKALKTGCRLESRQYTTSDALEPLTAMLSIIAVRLMQLRAVARTSPERPANSLVPSRWLKLLDGNGRHKKPITTIHEFFRALARLGGHLGRKRDGEPGWITLWRGLDKLLLMERGVLAYNRKCG